MTRRCRATHPTYQGSRLLEPGEEFTLPDDVRGPHVTHLVKHDLMDVNEDQKRILPTLHDEPLFEEWDEASKTWVKGR